MKKLLTLILVLALVMTSLVGCGGGTKDESKDNQTADKPELTVGFI